MDVSRATNQRQYPRHEISIDVIVVFPDSEPITMKTGNVSEGGIFLLADGKTRLPTVGTEFVATLSEFLNSTDPMALRARVAHRNDQGIGVEFLGPV
jgi:hypothetical protein